MSILESIRDIQNVYVGLHDSEDVSNTLNFVIKKLCLSDEEIQIVKGGSNDVVFVFEIITDDNDYFVIIYKNIEDMKEQLKLDTIDNDFFKFK